MEGLHQFIFQHILFAGLFLGFLAMLFIQLLFFWIFFSRLAFGKRCKRNPDKLPVSVIVLVNNQYNDLRKNLPEILNQDYPDYEVVVVNENAEDGSEELLERFSEQYPHLKIVEMKQSLNWFKGRKFPLSIGIKSAKNEILLLTDIRCSPATSRWIAEMVAAYDERTEIVLAYSTFHTGSKINIWYRFVAFYDALLYLSMAKSGLAFKGIGRNLSYRRSLFFDHKGFSSHYQINAGDDELFVNKAATRTNVRVQTSPASMINHTKSLSFAQWLANENDRLSTRRHFKLWHRFIISLFTTSSFFFYVLFVLLLIVNIQWPVVVVLFLLRFISQMIIFGFAGKKLSEKGLLLLSPVFEIFLVLIDAIIWLKLLFSKTNKWS
jgi:GT2 family glycosyltransferase